MSMFTNACKRRYCYALVLHLFIVYLKRKKKLSQGELERTPMLSSSLNMSVDFCKMFRFLSPFFFHFPSAMSTYCDSGFFLFL